MSQTKKTEEKYIRIGRYEGDQPQKEGDNLFYIGRRKQRNDFLRMLLDLPYKSSYLITGNRGSGKSSFVKHCLGIYGDNLMSRYLKGPRGRILFWDHIFRLLMILFMSLLVVLAYEFMLTLCSRSNGSFLVYKLVMVFFCLWPAILGYNIYNYMGSGEVFGFKVASFSGVALGVLLMSWGFGSGSGNLLLVLVILSLALLGVIPVFVSAVDKGFGSFFQISSVVLYLKVWFFVFISALLISPVLHHGDPSKILPATRLMAWLVFCVACFLTLLEHLLILPRAGKILADTALGRPSESSVVGVRRILKQTFFWHLFNAWVPSMVIQVNLGFDTLDYRRVIEAMLQGLKADYYRHFLSRESLLANVKSVATVLVVLFLSKNVLFLLEGSLIQAGFPQFDWLTSMSIPLGSLREEVLLLDFWLESQRVAPLACGLTPGLVGAGFIRYDISICYLQIVLFFLIYWLYRNLLNDSPFMPYVMIHREIERQLSGLSAKRRQASTTTQLFKIGYVGRNRQDQETLDIDQLDPRTVEIQFMALLERIRNPGIGFFGGANHGLMLPWAELTFVFDELDKLGLKGKVVPGYADTSDQPRAVDRVEVIQKLLANMKNLVSEGHARFVFIGGRDMHDEWHADRSLRTPFLSNIFNAEIYLPSFFLEPKRENNSLVNHDIPELGLGLERYLNNLRTLGFSLQKKWVDEERLFFMRDPLYPFYDSEYSDLSDSVSDLDEQELYIYDDFLCFLAFDSQGNPRKMESIISSFIVRDLSGETKEDRLVFAEEDVYRIQSSAALFRDLANRFHRQYSSKDDQPLVALFHIATVLLKYHRRAFSWRNLDHIDEMLHAHRSVETRQLVKNLVEFWDGSLLEYIGNGLYDYRFRSGVEAEMRYLSKINEDEKAALNFTLDESRELKEMFTMLIESEIGQDNYEYYVTLGEFHEQDGDFEFARSYYRRALELIDTKGKFLTDADLNDHHGRGGFTWVRIADGLNVSYLMARLKLMLRIALTHELSQNLEIARAVYRDCSHLAKILLRECATGLSNENSFDQIDLVKNLKLLFLPMFAEAWVTEKLRSGLDSGPDSVERLMGEFRVQLPYLKDGISDIHVSSNWVDIKHLTFGLIFADLHHKLGDLYFFKGQSRGRSGENATLDGYLIPACRNYVTALQEVRLYQVYRIKSSGPKFIGRKNVPPRLDKNHLPDYLVNILAQNTRDLSYAIFSRVRFCALYQEDFNAALLVDDIKTLGQLLERALPLFLNWISSAPKMQECFRFEELVLVEAHGSSGVGEEAGYVDSLVFEILSEFLLPLHQRIKEDDPSRKIRDFVIEITSTEWRKVFAAILFSVISANLYLLGGYAEKAQSCFFKLAEMLMSFYFFANAFPAGGTFGGGERFGLINRFFALGSIYSLKSALEPLAARHQSSKNLKMECYRSSAYHFIALWDVLLSTPEGTCIELLKKTKEALAEITQNLDKLAGAELGIKAESICPNTKPPWAYPYYAKLQFLKYRTDAALLGSNGGFDERLADVEDFQRAYQAFDDHSFYGPFYLGSTLGLFCLQKIKPVDALQYKSRLEQLKAAAIKLLTQSRQMYTMGKGYYDAISNYHFLFDDFNDFELLFPHAMQMAFADVTEHLLEQLKKSSD